MWCIWLGCASDEVHLPSNIILNSNSLHEQLMRIAVRASISPLHVYGCNGTNIWRTAFHCGNVRQYFVRKILKAKCKKQHRRDPPFIHANQMEFCQTEIHERTATKRTIFFGGYACRWSQCNFSCARLPSNFRLGLMCALNSNMFLFRFVFFFWRKLHQIIITSCPPASLAPTHQ